MYSYSMRPKGHVNGCRAQVMQGICFFWTTGEEAIEASRSDGQDAQHLEPCRGAWCVRACMCASLARMRLKDFT